MADDSAHGVTMLVTSEGQLVYQTDPFSCWVQAGTGAVIWRLVAVRFRDLSGRWHEVNQVGQVEQKNDHCRLTLSGSQGAGVLAADFWVDDDTLAVRIEVLAGTQAEWVAMDLAAGADEHFLGFGERFDSLDQRGKEVDLYVVKGESGGRTYKPVPFYFSTAGYGLRICTDVRCLVRLATVDDPTVVSIRNQAPSLEIRLILGDSPKQILSRYTRFTGKPPLPPAWVFGPWKSRDWTAEDRSTVLEDVDEVRRNRLAGTVKLIDAAWEPYLHSFTFAEDKFPDAEGLIRYVRSQGFRMVLWVAPWMVKYDPPSEAYEHCARNGYLIRNPQGEVYVHRLGNSPNFLGSCIDFTNPEAVAWWQEQIQRLVRMGVDGFKTDFGEQVPADARFYDGRTGRELHNIYPRLYNRATYEAMSRETHGVLLARSAWDGSQAYCACWAGDQSPDFGPATGLPSVILAGQTAGLSGFPFWASDIGGYFGTPTEEVFIRWIQFGAFSPIMQIHGMGKREPWKFSQRTLELYRRYAQVHLDLFPYLYTYAHRASETGVPILRALALEFPQDPGIWNDTVEHQYCFGEELLVAPVYYGEDGVRYLYLPEGEWRDFWGGQRYVGGQVHGVAAGLEQIPVMARSGAVIPLLDPSPETLLPTEAPNVRQATADLRLLVFPGNDGRFTLYDGTAFEWNEANWALTVRNSPLARQVSVRIMGEPASLLEASGSQGERLPHRVGSISGEKTYIRIQVENRGTYRLAWARGEASR